MLGKRIEVWLESRRLCVRQYYPKPKSFNECPGESGVLYPMEVWVQDVVSVGEMTTRLKWLNGKPLMYSAGEAV